MKIVGIAACTAGIAHTYIAKEKLVNAAEKAGHEIHIETQGTTGTKEKLSSEKIKEADVVIIAADISVAGMERFNDKNKVEIGTDVVIKAPNKFIKKVETLVKEANESRN